MCVCVCVCVFREFQSMMSALDDSLTKTLIDF